MLHLHNCCKQPDNLPVFPTRRFEDIPDETRFSNNETNVEETLPETKNFVRNRIILISILAVFVVFFQIRK